MKHTTAMPRFHVVHLSWLLIVLGCLQVPPRFGVAPASDGKYPAGEAAAVYLAVLETLYLSSGESPPMVVLWDSAIYRQSECLKEPCPRIPAHKSPIKSETVRDFERATRLMAPMRPDFGFHLPVHLLSEADRKGLEALGQAASDSLRKVNSYSEPSPFWLGFRKRYPGAWGFAALTRVGFDLRRTQALVQVMHNCSSGCGHAEDMFLEKIGGRWQVTERLLIGPRGSDWVDIVQRFNSLVGDGRDSLVLGQLRYLGPDARYLAITRRHIDSVRLFITDSIERDQLPRRIRGTIASRGRPIPFAQVFVRSAPTYPNPWARVVADSTGRYEVRNPPMGGTMLEVQCPGPGHRLGATLAAPGTYVFQAMDTTINITAPDVAPCWSRRTFHRLQSAWFESTEAVGASMPDSEERKVYRVVLDALRARNPRARAIAVFSHTITRCRYDPLCGSVQLSKLARERVVDSGMIREFNSKTTTSRALNPAFARSLGLRVITPQEIVYYAEESLPIAVRRMDSRGDTTLFWDAFRAMNGAGKGIISLGGIGFDSARTRAIVEARVDTAMPWPLSRTPMMLLKMIDGAWRVTLEDVGRGVTSGEWSDDRCVPAEAPGRMPKTAKEYLSGEYLVTLVSTVGRPGTRSVRLRLSKVLREGYFQWNAPPPRKRTPATLSTVFEVIDEATGRPNDYRSLDFLLDGAGLGIKRRRDDLMRFDGYTRFLLIRRVTDSGFFGSFSAGVFALDEFGHFCARRVSTARAPH